jgi:predicted nucleotidyltransferase
VSFEEVWARRVEDRFGSTPASFASLDDLILMKEAAARPRDIEDLKYLRRLREKRPR